MNAMIRRSLFVVYVPTVQIHKGATTVNARRNIQKEIPLNTAMVSYITSVIGTTWSNISHNLTLPYYLTFSNLTRPWLLRYLTLFYHYHLPIIYFTEPSIDCYLFDTKLSHLFFLNFRNK